MTTEGIIKVMKFGGTSVGSPERMRSISEIVLAEQGTRLVVLSALSGTTNALVEISKRFYEREIEAAFKLIDGLEEHYYNFTTELFKTSEQKDKADQLIKTHFDHLRSFSKDLFTIYEERAVLAEGELMSTAIFQYYLEECQIKSVLLQSLNFMRIDKDNEPDEWYIANNLKIEMDRFEGHEIFIAQGYICRNAYGEIDNLKRGGSDYTASLIGAAVNANEIQIWTDIDGMHNNDPRIVENTYPISELSFDEAAELAYFGAKILHPSSVRPARDKGIPVMLKNTMEPSKLGTVIHDKSAGNSIRAVAAKDGITAIKIKSGRMLMAYGFLRSIFEVFERFKTPIDMITTSEVAVSITIDNADHLEGIKKSLKKFGHVEIDHDLVIVCIVGDFMADQEGYAAQIFQALSEVPIRMISYGGSKNNISFLVSKEFKVKALKALNEGIFNQPE